MLQRSHWKRSFVVLFQSLDVILTIMTLLLGDLVAAVMGLCVVVAFLLPDLVVVALRTFAKNFFLFLFNFVLRKF